MDKFYRIEYIGKIKRTGKVFDTTYEETAKENNIYNEKLDYGPKDIISEDELIEGITEKLKEMKEGEEKEFIVPPEKAYGKRDPSKVDMVPKKDFDDTDVTPMPGMHVILDGKPAKIQTVSGGRVRVDFNNPLAGKRLKYKLKLKKVFEKDIEKSKILIKENLPVDEEEIETEEDKEKKKIKIKLPPGTFPEDEEEVKKELKEKIKEKTDYEEIEIREKTIEEEDEEDEKEENQ